MASIRRLTQVWPLILVIGLAGCGGGHWDDAGENWKRSSLDSAQQSSLSA